MAAIAQKPLVDEYQTRILGEIIADPPEWVRYFLKHDPWSKSEEILRALAKPRAQVAVKACHSSSKTFTAAEAVLWFLVRYPDAIVVSTAPTQTQVRELLWMEITKARDGALIQLPIPNLTELRIENGRYAIGRATNQGVRFQGFHGTVLVVIDEAPGVEAAIWDAIDGIRAGGDVRVLALGNPVIASGRFFEIFNEDRQGWAKFTISAFDTPNLKGFTLEDVMGHDAGDEWLYENPRPYLTTRAWVHERHNVLGGKNCEQHVRGEGKMGCGALENADFQSRVLGEFPQQSADALISQAWLDAARNREIAPDPTAGYVAGIDVAGQGKAETTLYVRQGENVVFFDAWASPDPRGEVIAALKQFEDDLTVYVDEIGIGYNFMLHVRDTLSERWQARCRVAERRDRNAKLPPEPRVEGINVGMGARSDRFDNKKAELYWGIRERLQDGEVRGLTDSRTISQLAGIRMETTPKGKTAIESKDSLAKRGVPSPDRAEAFMLCFSGEPRPQEFTFGSITAPSKWG